MQLPPAIRRIAPLWSRIAFSIVAVYLAWTFLGRYLTDRRWQQRALATTRQAEFDRTYGGADLKILQFYARDAVVLEGHQTVLCYGVLNASAVRVDPPIATLSPSLNRCIEASPERNTRYTLTAESASGQAMSSSLDIAVKPDPEELPRITYFRTSQHRVEEGRHVFELVFGQVNGEWVEIDPPVFPALHRAPLGKFYVAPRQTTTYTLTVTNKRGHRTRQALTVEVPPA